MPALDFANLRVFGNAAFRPQQREVIQAVMQVLAGAPVCPMPSVNPPPPRRQGPPPVTGVAGARCGAPPARGSLAAVAMTPARGVQGKDCFVLMPTGGGAPSRRARSLLPCPARRIAGHGQPASIQPTRDRRHRLLPG